MTGCQAVGLSGCRAVGLSGRNFRRPSLGESQKLRAGNSGDTKSAVKRGGVWIAPTMPERPMIHSFRDLIVWQKAVALSVTVYKATEAFPRSEMFGLASQLRRAAVSIASNVAEGKASGGQNYPRHVRLALGSEAEVQTHIEIARRLGILNETEAAALLKDVSEVGRMLSALLQSLPTN